MNPRPDGRPVPAGPVAIDPETMVLAVTQREAITFVPAVTRDLYPRPGITYVNMPGLPHARAVLAWLPGNTDRPAVSALRESARVIIRRRISGKNA